MSKITRIDQVWIGRMDAETNAWVRGVEAVCRRERVEWVLHGAEVLVEYGGADVLRAFDVLHGEVPERVWRVMVADWARWQFLARGGAGTLYLDADTRLTRGRLPDLRWLPGGLHCLGEGFDPSLPGVAGMFVAGAAGAQVAELAARLATGKVMGFLELDAEGRRALYADILAGFRLVYWLGPGWMRKVVVPQARDRGLHVHLLGQDVASCRNEGAWIYHVGRGDWTPAKRAV